LVYLVDLVHLVRWVQPNTSNKQGKPAGSHHSELPFSLALRYSDGYEIGETMITPDVLTEYVRKVMPDAAVTVMDRTGTMNHLKVVVVSAAFAGKNLLDRHRLVYQALDVPMKDGRIHALEITAQTTEEA
jgi:stress-induced morphogen